MNTQMRLKIAISLALVTAAVVIWVTLFSPGPQDDLSASPEQDDQDHAPGVQDEEVAVTTNPAIDSADDEVKTIPERISSLDPQFQKNLDLISSPNHAFDDRSDAIRALGDSLNEDEIAAIYDFLLSPPPARESDRTFDRTIKNNLLNLLRNQASPPEELTRTMTRMFHDTDQDAAVRDYAVQHLGAWHPHAGENERSEIVEVLIEGLVEDSTSIAGTALIALNELARDELLEAGVDINIGATAMEIARSPGASDLSRITAMQISARRNAPGVLDTAGEWALDSTASYARRLAAIAALGANGSMEAASLLGKVAAMEDRYLETALTSARQRLAAQVSTD